MRKTSDKKMGGFTIIELIVAIAIITIALVGFIPLTTSSMRLFSIAKQRHVATKIAQEGMEFAINKKENHVLCVRSGGCLAGWQHNLVGNFEINPNDPNELLPTNRFQVFAGKKICLHNNRYDQCVGPETPMAGNYIREVVIETIDSNSVRVKSIVTWGSNQSITFETLLFNN